MPTTPTKQPRNREIPVKVSTEEIEQIASQAKAAGFEQMSDYVRRKLKLPQAIVGRPRKALAD